MKITRKDVLYTAKLARLEIDDNQVDEFADQIGKILGYIDILESVDTKNISPTSHAAALTNVFREDEEKAHLEIDNVLANAPNKEDGFFIVPKIIS